MLSSSGAALKIGFFPLRITPAPLPEEAVFVAADSLVKAAKTAEALDKYNRRPIECRLAVAVLKRRLAERFGREVPLERLGANLFFQLVSRRYERGSILITSNQSLAGWGQVFGDQVIATAILDRLLHHSSTINIRGESYRLKDRRRRRLAGRHLLVVGRDVARAAGGHEFVALLHLGHRPAQRARRLARLAGVALHHGDRVQHLGGDRARVGHAVLARAAELAHAAAERER